MVDPAKATKGRRMSKKTRKKSPKPPTRKAARAQSAKPAKTPPSQTRRATAGKSGGSAASRESHKAPSKQLKPAPAAPARSTRAKTIAATKPVDGTAPRTKPGGKSAAPANRKSVLVEAAKAPDFRLPRDGGSTVSLSDYAGKKLVLFFYPRADTPGCTKEAIDFTRLASAFAASQTAVLGVSADPPRAQEAFRDKHQLSTPLVSDETHGMLNAYGVWGEKSMYGKTFHGILRTTVLVGADGRILKIWRKVKVDGHAGDVLATVRDL
jgi:thioredoxin-dependent peroxiredoxin